jgi:hypothetical protein
MINHTGGVWFSRNEKSGKHFLFFLMSWLLLLLKDCTADRVFVCTKILPE